MLTSAPGDFQVSPTIPHSSLPRLIRATPRIEDARLCQNTQDHGESRSIAPRCTCSCKQRVQPSAMRVYKAEQDVDVPIDFNLTELLNSNARPPSPGESGTIAKDDLDNRTITLRQLRSYAGRLAGGLAKAFTPRDQSRWAVILPNSVAYIEACHTILWLGGVFCPINHLLTVHELVSALSICQPEYIIAYAPIVPKLEEAITSMRSSNAQSPAPTVIIGCGRSPSHPALHTYLAAAPLPIPHYDNTQSRLASIHLSSGTTGNSKGVGLSHYNYVANVLQMFAYDPDHWTASERIASFTPFCHIANTTIPLFLGPWTGMAHLIMATYTLEGLCTLIAREGATATQCTPALAVAIANTDLTQRHDLRSLRHMVVGGLPLRADVYERFLAKGPWKTVQLYGMTEAAPYVVWQKVGETLPVRGQLGGLLPGMQARLVRGEAESGGKEGDAPEGGPGELWIQGPNVTTGYVENEAATRAAFKEGGWYNTGDVCTISPEGYLTVVGRTKELIKSSGFQVAPTELEGYLNGHAAIADVAVGATVDRERMTEVPTAFVVLKALPNLQGDEEKVNALKDIQRSLDGKVSGYKKLRGGVWEVTALPRTSTGKFIRTRLGEKKTGLSSFDGGDATAKL